MRISLLRISLLRISLLRFFKTFQKYLAYAFLGLFISLLRFLYLTNATFSQVQKSHKARTFCCIQFLSTPTTKAAQQQTHQGHPAIEYQIFLRNFIVLLQIIYFDTFQVYILNKAQIDPVLDKVKAQFDEISGKVFAMIPQAKPAEKTE